MFKFSVHNAVVGLAFFFFFFVRCFGHMVTRKLYVGQG